MGEVEMARAAVIAAAVDALNDGVLQRAEFDPPLANLITAALAEGARRERERVRGLALNGPILAGVRWTARADRTAGDTGPAWSALLAAITDEPASPVLSGKAARVGE